MIYLNNAASSYPKPDTVYEAIKKEIYKIPYHHGRSNYTNDNIVETCRKNLSNLFNSQKHTNLVFTSGSTESLNLAINGIDTFNKHIITSEIEHNSVLRPLKRLESANRTELSIINCDSDGFIQINKIEECIKDNTVAIIINHASNVTGVIQDIKAISKIAKKFNLYFIVDASQTAGIVPIDLVEVDIDVLAFTGHKSLFGISGIGGLYVKDGLKLNPLKVGGTGIRSDLLSQPKEMPLWLEAGTMNYSGIASLNAGVEYILNRGVSNILEKSRAIMLSLVNEIKKINNIILYGDVDVTKKIPIFCLNIESISNADVGLILEESFDIIVRSGLHCAPLIHKALGTYSQGSVRVSPSIFTKKSEISIFIEAISQISKIGNKK